jgi:hypothetical protein
MRARLIAIAAVLTAASLGIAACSVVGDGKVDKVDPPFGLDQTLPSSTTLAPTTTELATTTTGIDTSTTGVPTETVRLYFITSGQLNFVPTPLPAGPSLGQIMAALQAGPPNNELGVGLRNAVPDDVEIGVTDNNAGVAIVVLPEGFFDGMVVADQRLATAQIVLTLTDSRGIGQVQFNQAVQKPSGALTPAGQSLSRNDFIALVEGATPPSTSSSTTSTTLPPG